MKKVIVGFIAGFFIFLFGLHHIMCNMGLDNAERVSDQTISYAKEKLETYNNYLSNDRTKSLVHLLDKVSAFAEILKQEADAGADRVGWEPESGLADKHRWRYVCCLEGTAPERQCERNCGMSPESLYDQNADRGGHI